MLILTNVPAINNDAYTSFGSSSNLTIRFADKCCLVFSIFTSLLFNENKATSAPEMIKVTINKTISAIARKVVPCRLVARKIKER
jgi:hypothetical protein